MLLKRWIPLFILVFVGSLTLISWFVPHDPIGRLGKDFSQFFDIIASFAIILGGANLLKLQGLKILRRKKNWQYSVVTILGFAITAFVGLNYRSYFGGLPADMHSFLGGAHISHPKSHLFWIYWNIFTPLSATMYALLAFYVASASYRAFRARNVEATVLLAAGIILMLGRVPLGQQITAWLPEAGFFSTLRLENVSDWIYSYPNAAGQRAIAIGIALGIVSTSLRLILGIEKSFLGEE
ncbi:MAG: hypothetical protein QGG80_02985 [Candidatus Krumholzibacteria bacterium]|jgi:hypothetical protein|nr:hypothetical protein [Candidatus Krumholzibacteria bacterium]MDP6797529.1 hypothetical protein [Candidatus Krumholzibacteria bacterium]